MWLKPHITKLSFDKKITKVKFNNHEKNYTKTNKPIFFTTHF